jgi:hypothetical protein
MPIAAAIQARRLLHFTYDGFRRTVEPHTYGTDRKGHKAPWAYLRAEEASPASSSDGSSSMSTRCMASAPRRRPFGPRPNYKRGDQAFARIEAQL